MKISDDQSAGDWAEHGADQSGNGNEAHGADEFGFGECAYESEAADGNHHRSAAALQNAACDEQMKIAGDAAEERSERENSDGRAENAAGAEAVGHPSADGNKNGEAQRVAGEHGFHAERRDVERSGHGGHGGIQNRRVQRFHEKRDGNQPRHQTLAGFGHGRIRCARAARRFLCGQCFYFLIFIFGNFRFTAATTLACSGFPELRARASRAWAASSIGYFLADSSAKSDLGSFFRVAEVSLAMSAKS